MIIKARESYAVVGGLRSWGRAVRAFLLTPTCQLPSIALPPATRPDGPLTTPRARPPALGIARTAPATTPPQDQDPHELGDLN